MYYFHILRNSLESHYDSTRRKRHSCLILINVCGECGWIDGDPARSIFLCVCPGHSQRNRLGWERALLSCIYRSWAPPGWVDWNWGGGLPEGWQESGCTPESNKSQVDLALNFGSAVYIVCHGTSLTSMIKTAGDKSWAFPISWS